MKKKILASIMVVGLLALALGWGTYSWFSDTETSTDSTFTAGTLTLGTFTRTFSCPPGWAPGQSFVARWEIKNTGTVDAMFIGVDIHNWRHTDAVTDGFDADIANVISITRFEEYIPSYGWIDGLGNKFATGEQHYDLLVKDGVAPLTLKELMQSYILSSEPMAGGFVDEFGNNVAHLTDWVSGNGYDQVPAGYAALPAGTTYVLVLEFAFQGTAGNAYQGATGTFDLTFYATQDLSTLP
jgi:predicted ribosomally synthesized peptide with SipW-like signal peptide